MRERTLDVGGVPTRLYEGESADLLLYGHRGTLSKDDERSVHLCRTLARATGLSVLAIDAPQHGARSPRTGDSVRDRSLVEEAIVAGGEQAAADWLAVIGALDQGPAVAYVGFSMGAMHGTITAARIPTLRAAVFGMAGVPVFALANVLESGTDTPHMAAARCMESCEVLMVNTIGDELFPPAAALALFDAFPPGRKRMMLWEGDHASEPPEMLDEIVQFLRRHVEPFEHASAPPGGTRPADVDAARR